MKNKEQLSYIFLCHLFSRIKNRNSGYKGRILIFPVKKLATFGLISEITTSGSAAKRL
jgi:hypothetical protein